MPNTTALKADADRTSAQRPAAIAWLLILVALVHLPSLFNPFFIDDYVYLDAVHDLSWPDVPGLFATATMDESASGVWWTPEGLLPFYRPFAILTFAAEYRIWGLNPFGFHLTNLLLHLLCTWLTWRLARHFFEDHRWAIVAAGLFAIHPGHMEALLWVSGRFDLLVCACVLGSLVGYLNWQQRGGGWIVLSMALFALGLGSKETALILPAALLGCEWLHRRESQRKRPWRQLVAAFGVFAVVALVYLWQRFRLFGGLGTMPPPYGVDLSSPSALGVILWNFAQYLLDMVFLVQIDAIYIDAFWSRHPWLLVAIGAAAVGVVLYCWRVSGGRPSFRVGLLMTVLFTAPALMAMPGERNVYLPLAGVALIGASVAASLMERFGDDLTRLRRLRRAGWAIVAVCLVALVPEQMLAWRIGHVGEGVYHDLMAALPNPPPDARIFVVGQCPLNAVGFTQGVRLKYGRRDITACNLTLAPNFLNQAQDTIYRTGPSSIRIVREGVPFFKSFLERFLMFSRPSQLAQSARRMNVELLSTPDLQRDVTELDFRLPAPLEDERIILLAWDNEHLRTVYDVIWGGRRPRLVPAAVRELPAAYAGS